MTSVLPPINTPVSDPTTGKMNPIWYRYFFQAALPEKFTAPIPFIINEDGMTAPNSEYLQVIGTDNSWYGAFDRYSNDTLPVYIGFRKSRGTPFNFNAVQPGDQLSALQSYGTDGSGFQPSVTMNAFADSGGTVAPGIVPGFFSLLTADASGVLHTCLTADRNQVVTIPSVDLTDGTANSGARSLIGWDLTNTLINSSLTPGANTITMQLGPYSLTSGDLLCGWAVQEVTTPEATSNALVSNQLFIATSSGTTAPVSSSDIFVGNISAQFVTNVTPAQHHMTFVAGGYLRVGSTGTWYVTNTINWDADLVTPGTANNICAIVLVRFPSGLMGSI
jgi:hypothetical protein